MMFEDHSMMFERSDTQETATTTYTPRVSGSWLEALYSLYKLPKGLKFRIKAQIFLVKSSPCHYPMHLVFSFVAAHYPAVTYMICWSYGCNKGRLILLSSHFPTFFLYLPQVFNIYSNVFIKLIFFIYLVGEDPGFDSGAA